MALPITLLLLLAIPFDRFRMALAVLLPVFRATSAGWRARPRRRPNRCGFSRADSRCAVVAGNPAGCKRFVQVDRWMAEKSAGSSGNSGSVSCAVLVLLGRSFPNFQGKQIGPTGDYRNFYRVLTASLRVGLRRWDSRLRRTGEIGSLSHRP